MLSGDRRRGPPDGLAVVADSTAISSDDAETASSSGPVARSRSRELEVGGWGRRRRRPRPTSTADEGLDNVHLWVKWRVGGGRYASTRTPTLVRIKDGRSGSRRRMIVESSQHLLPFTSSPRPPKNVGESSFYHLFCLIHSTIHEYLLLYARLTSSGATRSLEIENFSCSKRSKSKTTIFLSSGPHH